VANEDVGRTEKVSATEDQARARATGSRKPGVVGRMMEQCRETVEGIRPPRPDWRTFAWGLLLLILIVFIVRNWAPLRINLFGWYLDAPRAVVLAIFFALGMVTTWLIEIRNRRARAAEEEPDPAEQSEEEYLWEEDFDEHEVRATEIPPEAFEPGPDDFAETDEEMVDDLDEELTPAEEDVEPEPPAFAEVEDDPEGGEGETGRLDEAQTAEDETVGDALSEEYHFDSPDEVDDAATDPDMAEDAEQDSDADDAGDDSSEDDDSDKPFWRM
jgi:uncharacterized integral membrane protein